MNPSNPKFSSIVPKCVKSEDPEAEIFLRNQDLIAAIENFMSQGTEIWKVMLFFGNVNELIQNLVVRLKESENWKEVQCPQSKEEDSVATICGFEDEFQNLKV